MTAQLASTTPPLLPDQRCFLPGVKRSAVVSRRWARSVMDSWAVPVEVAGDVELGVGEIVANAVVHGLAGAVCCRLWMTGVRIRVEVVEYLGPDHPAANPLPVFLGDLAETGRGLRLVQDLSLEWGSEPNKAHGGRGLCVWANFDRRGPACRGAM